MAAVLKICFLLLHLNQKPIGWNLVGSFGVTCSSKIAKTVRNENQRRPPWLFENISFVSSPEPKDQWT